MRTISSNDLPQTQHHRSCTPVAGCLRTCNRARAIGGNRTVYRLKIGGYKSCDNACGSRRNRRKSHGQSTEALDGSIDLSRPSSSSFCCPRKPRPFYCKRNIDMDQLPPTKGGREQVLVVSNLPSVEGREQLLAITNLVMMSDSQNDDVFVY